MHQPPMQGFILNADDYALHEPGDRAIIELAQQGVVTSTTALVLSPRWTQAAQVLHNTVPPEQLNVGLHLDFTTAYATNNPAGRKVSQLIIASWLRQLNAQEVMRSIQTQLTQFEDAMQRMPVSIDGHEHVHQFPVIREALIEAVCTRYPASGLRPKLRLCRSTGAHSTKARIIHTLGSARLAQLAHSNGLQTNHSFAGVYGFEESADLATLWRGWLHGTPSKRLIMCHVADTATAQPGDPITAARHREYQWLRSPAFAQLCTQHGMQPVQWGSATFS